MLRTVRDIDFSNKIALVRVDFNLPMQNGIVQSVKRIEASKATIEYILERGAKVLLLSHLGRPVEGIYSEEYSLKQIIPSVESVLGREIAFAPSYIDGIFPEGQCILCENIRFCEGEKENSDTLSKRLASLCDVFVLDAFAVSHRKHASTYGISLYAKESCAGLLLEKEIISLETVLSQSAGSCLAIVGGSKVSTKIEVLSKIAEKVDTLIVGGGIANTFLASKGFSVGKSLYEEEYSEIAKRICAKTKVILPVDVKVCKKIDETAKLSTKDVAMLSADDYIVDIGEETISLYENEIAKAKNILWNGPIGIFEIASMSEGTKRIAEAIGSSSAFSVAGGGDTISAAEKFRVYNALSYVSTGGGAFLEYIESTSFASINILCSNKD
ncbi:MAG: phosphoglycerate kinase [Desulfovibrionaceae bacterium]